MKILRKGSCWAVGLAMLSLLAACSRKEAPTQDPQSNACLDPSLNAAAGDEGSAQIFWPDPIAASGIPLLGPSSLELDQYRIGARIKNLGGRGVLEGRYVDVRNGLSCSEGFSAFSERNEFHFSQRDERFQEAMAYHVGDSFRAMLDSAGYLDHRDALRIISPCAHLENAFYSSGRSPLGRRSEKVCLGISRATPGAAYSDDASVIAHEIQHGATGNTYSVNQDLNVFFYDEAGALNEAISDFMALIFIAPGVSENIDPRIFGRWALGTFIPNHSAVRGAHRCPVYDADFPRCSRFPEFSSETNTVSLVYPDGLGWPFPRRFPAPGYLRSTYLGFQSQEEIHNDGLILEGALWDGYEAIKSRKDASSAQRLMVRAVMEAIKHLPKSDLDNLSPVTFRNFAKELVDWAPAVGFDSGDVAALSEALAARGLHGGPTLDDASWASADPTEPLRVMDHPTKLKAWLSMLGSDLSQVTHGIQTADGRLSRGEVATIWFNIRNSSAITAGGVLLKIRSLNPQVTFLDGATNIGAVSPELAQIRYAKINGTAIVSSLASSNPTYDVPTSNTYFKTNPFFDQTLHRAVWVRVGSGLAPNTAVEFEVTAVPSNGVAATTVFRATVQ